MMIPYEPTMSRARALTLAARGRLQIDLQTLYDLLMQIDNRGRA